MTDTSLAPERTAETAPQLTVVLPISVPPLADAAGSRSPAPKTSRQIASVAKSGLTLFAGLCAALALFLFVGTGFVHSRDQISLHRQFRSMAQNGLLPPLTDQQGRALPIAIGSPVALLEIPRLSLSQVVVEGSNGSRTESGPGHLPVTPLPGQFGNSVIVARRMTYGGPFRHLDRLRAGDEIRAVTGRGTVTYRVFAAGSVPSAQRAPFGTLDDGAPAHNTINSLTLVTSDPPLVSDARFVVQAQLVGPAYGFTPAPYQAHAEDLGLAGERGAWLPLIGVLELLLIACVGAVWLFRRWNRSCAWIVAVPTVAAAMWMVFEQFVRVLPGAL